MRDFHAHTLNSWPRRKKGDLIFQSTNEAIYYAQICEDRLAAYDLLAKWRKNTLETIKDVKAYASINYDRLFDLAVRAQFYRDAMEEIQRLNQGDS